MKVHKTQLLQACRNKQIMAATGSGQTHLLLIKLLEIIKYLPLPGMKQLKPALAAK